VTAAGPRLAFAGPSLHGVAPPPGVEILPPAGEGDLYRAVATRAPAAVAIVDGWFEHRAAIWHKEIVWALRRGVAVLGAASMGALRAVELAPFGMEGVGRVFEAYRDGRLDADDAVAVIHAPVELGCAPLSLAHADLDLLLNDAAAAGAVRPATAAAMRAASRAAHFRDRTWALALAAVPPDERDALDRFRAAAGPLPKTRDALECLERLRTAGPPPPGPDAPATVHQRAALARALGGT
jgi:hypothetical protein